MINLILSDYIKKWLKSGPTMAGVALVLTPALLSLATDSQRERNSAWIHEETNGTS